jgi:hypothetical protein
VRGNRNEKALYPQHYHPHPDPPPSEGGEIRGFPDGHYLIESETIERDCGGNAPYAIRGLNGGGVRKLRS